MKPPPGSGMSDKGLAPRYFDTGASPDCACKVLALSFGNEDNARGLSYIFGAARLAAERLGASPHVANIRAGPRPADQKERSSLGLPLGLSSVVRGRSYVQTPARQAIYPVLLEKNPSLMDFLSRGGG